MLIVPPLLMARESNMQVPFRVRVVPPGMVKEPLPPTMPPVQVMAEPVRAIGAVPFSVPFCISSVAMLTVLAPFSVRVPPLTVTSPTLAMALIVVVAPEFFVVPVTPYVALMVLVPCENSMVPVPLKFEPESKLRVSAVLKFITAPEETSKVAPVLVTLAR